MALGVRRTIELSSNWRSIFEQSEITTTAYYYVTVNLCLPTKYPFAELLGHIPIRILHTQIPWTSRLVHCSIQSRVNGNDLWRNWLLFHLTTYCNVLFYYLLISGSSYTCLAISLERYMGICYPNTSSRFRKLRYYSVAIVLACFLIDAPRFLEVEVRYTLPKTL